MSESETMSKHAPLEDDVSANSGGALIRSAREASGVSLSALSTLLKVSPAKLEALESDRWDLLPDIVFARALASSVCRALHIEPAPVLARFPSLSTPSMKTDESGINTPFRTQNDGRGMAWLSQLQKPGTLAVLVLIVAAVALFFIPADLLKNEFSRALSGSESIESNSNEVVSTAIATNEIVPTPAAVETEQSLPVPSMPNSEKLATANLSQESTASPLPLTVEGNGALTGTVVLKPAGTSWVEVVDAGGVVKVRKIMADGEVIGASGTGPLSVVIGRADVVTVEVRGKSLSLINLTKNNIARFEVK